MDLVCSRCGEPWELYYVLHEEPEAFERRDSLIVKCPSCPKDIEEVGEEMRMRGSAAEAIADALGDDVDGAASAILDFLRV